jgi:uncharacterized Zn finger protein
MDVRVVAASSPILWPCPQCHSVNVKVVGTRKELWPYVWARCEDCHEVWPAQESPARAAEPVMPPAFS